VTDAGRKKAQARFVVNLIEDAQNRLLFLKRATHLERSPGQWGLCSGGMEDGETPDAASTRELREELGDAIHLEPVRSIGPVRDRLYGGIYDFHLFHLRWRGGTIRLNHEHTEYAWITKEAFRDYDVMRGLDEDILYLDIWPRMYLRAEFLPPEHQA
jgi:dihydroneopterin triphosphate diphosphatase